MKFLLSLAVCLLCLTSAPAQTVITHGGTYTYPTLQSTNPAVPLISIATDEAVHIDGSLLICKGICISGTGTVALNLTVTNTTGVCLDPGVAGQQRGQFVQAILAGTIDVEHTTNLGCSYGIGVYNSPNLTACRISNNAIGFADDRASNGAGLVTGARPSLGHGWFLASVTAPNGCDLGWNQFVTPPGLGSGEDAINIYRSQGTAAHPINIHDSYIEGASSPPGSGYTGSCGIVDGTATALSAYTTWSNSQCVRVSGVGWSIANGHDNSMTGMRVVACGQDASGGWVMAAFANPITIENDYGQDSATFTNNTISGTTGGMLRPAADSTIQTVTGYKQGGLPASNTITGSSFTDLCRSGGVVTLAQYATEWTAWQSKLATVGQTVGDQHLN